MEKTLSLKSHKKTANYSTYDPCRKTKMPVVMHEIEFLQLHLYTLIHKRTKTINYFVHTNPANALQLNRQMVFL